MSDHFNLLQDSFVKSKVPTEIMNGVKDLKGMAAFRKVSVDLVPPCKIWQVVYFSS